MTLSVSSDIRRVTLLILVVVGTAGCGGLHAPRAGTPSGTPPPIPARTINWEQPLRGGVIRDSVQDASDELMFAPIAPAGLGTPEKILITDPGASDLPDRTIVFVYDHPVFGTFSIEELRATITQEQLERLLTCGEEEVGCDASGYSLVKVRGDITALLNAGSVSTNISWLEQDLFVLIIGPAETLSPDEIVQIASLI